MDQRYRTFLRRFVALIIDGMVLWPVSKVLGFVYASGTVPLIIFLAMTLESVCYLAYSIYMHGRFGQTIGKFITKVQVISIDERPLSMRQAFLRDAVLVVFTSLYLVVALPAISSGASPNDSQFERGFLLFLSNSMMIWALFEMVTMLSNPQRRAIHDFIAGSVVVRRSNSRRSGPPSAAADQ